MSYIKLSEEYKEKFKTIDNEVLKQEYLRISDAIREDSREDALLEKADYIKNQIALNVIYG